MKISAILKILISVFIIFSASACISILIFTSVIENSATAIYLKTEYKQIGFDFLNNLDLLTRLARSYAQFGQKFYYDEYLYELYTVNQREKTITQLKELRITEDGLALIYKAIDYSNELVELEAKALKGIANNNFTQANKILFSEEYNGRRNQVATSIKEFQTYVNALAEARVNHAKQVFRKMFFISTVLVFFAIITAIISFVIITNKIRSISRLTEITKEIINGNLDIPITSNAKDELGDLTRSFAVMLNRIKSITTVLSYNAKTDALTQIANRHSFLLNAPSFFDFHIRLNKPITILFFDIDDFKKVNDNLGHPFGDKVLKNFAIIVSRSIRSFDLFCRYGGEEFIVLLSNTEQKSGIAIGERIFADIKKTSFPEKPDFNYTVSVGLFTSIPQKNESVEKYINKADQAMYTAKKNGKNRIEVYSEQIVS